MITQLLGKKLGMSTVFTPDGNAVPVTVIEAGPCVVLQVKDKDKDGYRALQLGFDEKRVKSACKPELAHCKKAETTPKKFVCEVRIPEASKTEFKIGQIIKFDEIFRDGDFVDVIGWTKGRGFQGVFKRWGFAGADAGHGTHEFFRHGGSIGTNTKPGHVHKGRKMPGHMGNERTTMLSLKVVAFKPEDNQILVRGSVPGMNNGYVLVKVAAKKRRKAQDKSAA
jgi:large subunit ribosomal protein L3